ncbi:acyl-CoA carboxylase subunit epsilon [Stackebrandtia soli]|uniref:acyl-CoA carboxylase subunit epsilon n=1 Tax=Stackebrandtia soli TaxID=1892856 RepID=UPI0039E780D3
MDIRVTAGSPNAEELATLVAVLTAVGTADGPPPPSARRPWTDPALRLGVARTWRDSCLPQ